MTLRMVRRSLLAVVSLLAAAGCGLCQKPVADSTTVTTTGQLEVVLHERGSCGVGLCTLAGWGRVLVRPAGSLVAVHDEYFLDSVRVTVPPGRYDVVVAPDGAPVEHAARDVSLGGASGLRLERSYWSDADATVLALFFAAGTEASKAEVLAFLGATEIPLTSPPAAFPEVRVRLAHRDHPDLAGERAMAAFPGVVVGFRADAYCGPGGWFEVTPGTPGEHHHHDHWD
jgi:hypothetical protein